MSATNGAVTGSSTLKVILPFDRRGCTAPNLNIVVPEGGYPAVGLFLRDRGYRGKRVMITRALFATVRACIRFTHPVTRSVVFVTESTRPMVLNVVLEGKNTATMNIITQRSIYCFYQTFTAGGNGFYSDVVSNAPSDLVKSANLWGLNLRDPFEEDDEGRICGLECPNRPRKMLSGQGIGRVCWNRSGYELVVPVDTRMYWNLGGYCVNPGCLDKEPELYHG